MADLHAALGAGPPAGTSQITLFVPSVDRCSHPIDQRYWVEETLAVFGRLFRGATAFPPGRGVWRDDDAGGALLFEEPVMVISYIEPSLLEDDAVLADLRGFLHRLGRETNQGEVGVVIDGEFFGITAYDEEDD